MSRTVKQSIKVLASPKFYGVCHHENVRLAHLGASLFGDSVGIATLDLTTGVEAATVVGAAQLHQIIQKIKSIG